MSGRKVVGFNSFSFLLLLFDSSFTRFNLTWMMMGRYYYYTQMYIASNTLHSTYIISKLATHLPFAHIQLDIHYKMDLYFLNIYQVVYAISFPFFLFLFSPVLFLFRILFFFFLFIKLSSIDSKQSLLSTMNLDLVFLIRLNLSRFIMLLWNDSLAEINLKDQLLRK